MSRLRGTARRVAKRARSRFQSTLLSYPRRVQCNACGWQGRHFLSDSWHAHVICPSCRTEVRHRLFLAALQHLDDLSFDRVIGGKVILHFAPEDVISTALRAKARHYVTADYLRPDCDLGLDMSAMPEVEDGGFDVVVACDVLEHVPDYQKALEEVHRILSSEGLGIFTVPQKDHLSATYEDPTILSPAARTEHFGQWDHLRIFGADFSATVEAKGFSVRAVDENRFDEDLQRRHVLSPPVLSTHPLATNFRKVFFCTKTA